MADPLRRTLFAKLRGKKPKKTASGGGSRSHEGKAKLLHQRRRRQQQHQHHQQQHQHQQLQAGPGGVGSGGSSRGSPLPGGGEDERPGVGAGLAGRELPSPGLSQVAAPPSPDDDDDGGDYYDNQQPRGCEGQRAEVGAGAGVVVVAVSAASPGGGSGQQQQQEESAREKERLRSRLHEAYYLLIHAMHDLPVDIPHRDTGRAPSPGRASTTACPPPPRRSEHASPGPPAPLRPPLQRSVSDGVIDYVSLLVAEPRGCCRGVEGLCPQGQAGCSLIHHHVPAAEASECAEDHVAQPPESGSMLGDASCKVAKLRCSADGVCGSSDEQDGRQGCSLKPPAVTVNKMQEWMHRGRMLSMEMKERISGSVKVSVPSASLPAQAIGKAEEAQKASFPVAVRAQGNKAASSPTSQRVLLTGRQLLWQLVHSFTGTCAWFCLNTSTWCLVLQNRLSGSGILPSGLLLI